LGVLFHELGHDLVLALNLGFELLDLGVLGILGRLGFTAVAKGEVSVLEELALPVVEAAGGDAMLVAELGDRDVLKEMPPLFCLSRNWTFLRSWLNNHEWRISHEPQWYPSSLFPSGESCHLAV
jgi:hypothetical protein